MPAVLSARKIYNTSCRPSKNQTDQNLYLTNFKIETSQYAKMSKTVKVAAIQAEPVWQDLQGGVDKSIRLIQDAASNGANVIGFPEVFIPGYPW
jgi:hypothetical protein